MAPSGVTPFYESTPQRRAMVALPAHAEPQLTDFKPPPRTTGQNQCECGPSRPCTPGQVWTRQHPDLVIAAEDRIGDADNARELWNLCAAKDVDTLVYVGVASNICVCQRDFGMFNARRHGYRTFFVRDLVEAITANGVDPATLAPDSNFTPAKGTQLTEQYLERHVAASFESRQILAEAGLGPADKRPHAVFVIADDEYRTEETLPAFAMEHLEPRIRCTFVNSDPANRNSLLGIEAVHDGDLVVLSVRRRFFPVPQMDVLERYIRSGKPLIVVRAGISPFAEAGDLRRTGEGQVVWQDFDREVLGCVYNFYDAAAREHGSDVWVATAKKDHPILRALEDIQFHTPAWIYRVRPLQKDATVLLEGRWSGEVSPEPVAWAIPREGGPVFYTSLGHPDDFQRPEFIRLLKNAVFWAISIASKDGSGGI
jgi:hypothetical protein